MNRLGSVSLFTVGVALFAGCATPGNAPVAKAEMIGRSGSAVSGTVSFQEVAGGLRIQANITGLMPGEHGFHIHEVGDCSAPDASSAKGHFNPDAKTHGHHATMNRHAGDMQNLIADTQGKAVYDQTITGLALNGASGILGRSVVIHADPDDYKSQPAGNSGKRVSCGVIS